MPELKQEQEHASTSSIKCSNTAERKIVGLYGVSGVGKSFLLNQLKKELGDDDFVFYEGSELIASVLPDGLEEFQALTEVEKVPVREKAIRNAQKLNDGNEKVIVIVGHYMFWDEEKDLKTLVMTQEDLETYTHILYLNITADTIRLRRQHDKLKKRAEESISHLKSWKKREMEDLRRVCYEYNILFTILFEGPQMLRQAVSLLQDIECNTEASNQSIARDELDSMFRACNQRLKTLLVLDADKTLAAVDTGEMFWKKVSELWPNKVEKNPLKTLFSSNMKYTYTAFRQAMLLYEETLDKEQFDEVCKAVAAATNMYPEFVSLLQVVAEQGHIRAVIMTCGLRQVWEEVLKRHDLYRKVKVIGGGRLANRFVVTGDTKADLVAHAKDIHKVYVWAFGDSPLDLGMLKEADRAIVIIGEEHTRSKSMKTALLNAIDFDGLRASQVVLPTILSPGLTLDKPPMVRLTGSELLLDILRTEPQSDDFEIIHATEKNAAKLLMTPMRDANNVGPSLREAHRHVGRYLATEFLSEVSGVEEYTIPHVQGHQTVGYRMMHENQTLIVPMMRGGEPMAFGVNDALPGASFLHAREPHDILDKHIYGQLSIILVDSVVNSGKSVLEFVQHIRRIHATIRIIVVAGVVQKDAVSRLGKEACCQLNFKFIALRISDNKFTGRGGTDTGNRLFNTTQLD